MINSSSIHDGLVNILDRKPTSEEIEHIVKVLPSDIVSIGDTWGYCDTEFREMAYIWMREKLQKYKEVKSIK